MNEITRTEYLIILDALTYTKQAAENYQYYPGIEFKAEKLTQIELTIKKVKAAMKDAPETDI